MKKIYFKLDEENIVTEITEEETEHWYCDVDDDVELKTIVEVLELDKHPAKWESGCLILLTDEIVADHDSYVHVEKVESLEEYVKKLEERIKSLETAIHNITGGVEHEVEIEL